MAEGRDIKRCPDFRPDSVSQCDVEPTPCQLQPAQIPALYDWIKYQTVVDARLTFFFKANWPEISELLKI